ncbi:MAG: type II toxin-antitoxin system HipA family toxin [Coriobacteriia bacterium]|nr:type II toxin-antitoxin system HipA family toxin [Coriobacteriia bacterium]
MVTDVAAVRCGELDVGAISYDTETGLGSFEYEPHFVRTGIELSPLKMALSARVYSFPEADPEVFHGLPGMIADSLPDDFGNAVLAAWTASRGRSTADITPIERLKYIGQRGMGALSYHPAERRKGLNASQQVEIESLVAVAQEVLNERADFGVQLGAHGRNDEDAMLALLSVGVSAGGARPKAVLAFNDDFTSVRSGQVDVPDGFTHCIMKFDGVSEHSRSEETFGDPLGYGAMEYVYYLMATACEIEMMPCRLLDEGNRRHFITQRFDRVGNRKRHVQTLNALAHVSYKRAGSYSYAELFATARELGLGAEDAMQLFRRMVFNIVARNHDDHSKNVSFMLDEDGRWRLAPAYDLAYSYKPGSPWVASHWMTLNGKRDDFTREDFYAVQRLSPLFTKRRIDEVIDETVEHVSRWDVLAAEHGVPNGLRETVSRNLRLAV